MLTTGRLVFHRKPVCKLRAIVGQDFSDVDERSDLQSAQEVDADSDGNSRTPDDTQWTELSLILRGSEGEAEIHIDPAAVSPLVLKIRSPYASLAKQTAIFLCKQTAGIIALSLSDGQC
jgi:hypothetical protein